MATNKSCWYYDRQLENKLTSVTLHANTVFDGKEWQPWNKETEGGGKYPYGKEPLCRSVLTEDFQISVSNVFSAGGGDVLGDVVNSILHSVAPYADLTKNFIDTVRNEVGARVKADEEVEVVDKDGKKTKKKTVVGAALAGINWALNQFSGDDETKALSVVNSNFIVQGTRFTYYSGTGIDFGNLGMRFTIFPRWTEDGKIETVNQQLDDLFPYVMGKYEPFRYEEKDPKTGKKDIHQVDILGWQRPPAGYRADYRDIDNNALFGTLKLKIGPYYTLESLVCTGLNYTLSKQMVKLPQGAGYKNTPYNKVLQFSPLYADVNLVLAPGTKYSDHSMKNFVYGIGISDGFNDRAQELANELDESLAERQNEITRKYGL